MDVRHLEELMSGAVSPTSMESVDTKRFPSRVELVYSFLSGFLIGLVIASALGFWVLVVIGYE